MSKRSPVPWGASLSTAMKCAGFFGRAFGPPLSSEPRFHWALSRASNHFPHPSGPREVSVPANMPIVVDTIRYCGLRPSSRYWDDSELDLALQQSLSPSRRCCRGPYCMAARPPFQEYGTAVANAVFLVMTPPRRSELVLKAVRRTFGDVGMSLQPIQTDCGGNAQCWRLMVINNPELALCLRGAWQRLPETQHPGRHSSFLCSSNGILDRSAQPLVQQKSFRSRFARWRWRR